MFGALYQGNQIKHKGLDLLVSAVTDDTVLTAAVASAIPTDGDFADSLKEFAQYH
jgi:hypothetical protein